MLRNDFKQRVLSWTVGGVAGLCLVMAPVIAGQVPPADPANQILQNGLDALSDNQPEEARQYFERVMRTYPRTPAAQSAERALENLRSGDNNDGGDADTADVREPIAGPSAPRRQPGEGAVTSTSRKAEADEQSGRLRRAFLMAAGDRVFFAENSAAIGGRARAALEGQARWLKARPNLKVTIISRADDGGSASDSTALSQKRAEAVREKLVEAGLPTERIGIDARGDHDPIATCRLPQCQAQNRHVETLVSFGNGPGIPGMASSKPPGRKDAEASQPVSSRPLTR